MKAYRKAFSVIGPLREGNLGGCEWLVVRHRPNRVLAKCYTHSAAKRIAAAMNRPFFKGIIYLTPLAVWMHNVLIGG